MLCSTPLFYYVQQHLRQELLDEALLKKSQDGTEVDGRAFQRRSHHPRQNFVQYVMGASSSTEPLGTGKSTVALSKSPSLSYFLNFFRPDTKDRTRSMTMSASSPTAATAIATLESASFPPSTSPSVSPAMAVLTDRMLLHQITEWLPGWPYAIGEFASATMQKYDFADAGDMYNPYEYPRVRDGTLSLPQLAVVEDNLDMLGLLHFLHEDPYYASSGMVEFDQDVFRCAVAFQRLELLRRLCGSLPEYETWSWQPTLMQVAVRKGSVEIVDFLYRYSPDPAIKLSALELDSTVARDGKLDLVQWFHERDYPFGACAMNYAAQYGHLDVVKFLHEHRTEGCTVNAMTYAATEGHLEIVKFLHEHRNEGCTTFAMDEAASKGYFDIVKFLHEHRKEGCTTDAMDFAAIHGHLDIVEFLHEHRTEGCTTDAIDNAAIYGRMEVVKFLLANRSEGCSFEGLNQAAIHGQVEIVKHLVQNLKGVSPRKLYKMARNLECVKLVQIFEQDLGFKPGILSPIRSFFRDRRKKREEEDDDDDDDDDPILAMVRCFQNT